MERHVHGLSGMQCDMAQLQETGCWICGVTVYEAVVEHEPHGGAMALTSRSIHLLE